jgi:hypothetical protein
MRDPQRPLVYHQGLAPFSPATNAPLTSSFAPSSVACTYTPRPPAATPIFGLGCLPLITDQDRRPASTNAHGLGTPGYSIPGRCRCRFCRFRWERDPPPVAREGRASLLPFLRPPVSGGATGGCSYLSAEEARQVPAGPLGCVSRGSGRRGCARARAKTTIWK